MCCVRSELTVRMNLNLTFIQENMSSRVKLEMDTCLANLD